MFFSRQNRNTDAPGTGVYTKDLAHNLTRSHVSLRSPLLPENQGHSARAVTAHQLSMFPVVSHISVRNLIRNVDLRETRAHRTHTNGQHLHVFDSSLTRTVQCRLLRHRTDSRQAIPPCVDRQGLTLELRRVSGGCLCVVFRGSVCVCITFSASWQYQDLCSSCVDLQENYASCSKSRHFEAGTPWRRNNY